MLDTPPASANPQPATILVVDDEPPLRDMLAQFLEIHGFRVVTAEDGETALHLVANVQPDLILLDVMMPGLDGFSVCRQLKSQPDTVFIPVVILTALRNTKDRIQGAAAGADDFLSKPFDQTELITRVKSLLRIKNLHDQLENYNQELEQRVAERTAELQHALDELQELDQLKSDFIANVSHELRTPLMHVKGYVDLLGDEALGKLSDKQKHGLQVAQEAVERLLIIVGDILDFSSVNSQPLTRKPVMVDNVFNKVVQAQASHALRCKITIQSEIERSVPTVLANTDALERILRHLVDNAIKFSSPGGMIKLSAKHTPPLVRLAVQDDGPGLSPLQQARIFELFYQVDGSSTREAGGLGVGLTVAKRLAEAHGSRIQVDSKLGQGCKFYFDLETA